MNTVQVDDLFIYLFKAYSPINRTGPPQGFSLKTNQILHKLNIYKTCTFYKRKTYKHNPKVSPFDLALVKKKKKKKKKSHMKLGDAGTTDRFGLAF